MTRIDVQLSSASTAQQDVLATLPNSFRLGDAGVTVVSGDALDSAGEGPAMIVDPGLASAAALTALAERGAIIGLALDAAPALPDAAIAASRAKNNDTPLIVDAAAETTGALRAALFELLMLLDTLGFPTSDARILTKRDGEIVLAVDGARVSARHSFRTRYAVETVSRTLRREIVVAPTALATPAEMRLFDANGTATPLPRYEGGRRASWRAFHGELTEGTKSGQIATAIRLLTLLEDAGLA